MSALERLKEAVARVKPKYAVPVESDDLRELIATAESREAALHAETERGNALAVRVVELEAIHDYELERADKASRERDTLRAELAGAQSQAAAACRERDVANNAFEMACQRTRRVEAALAARDAEVPGLSTTPGYTMGDVDRIESARGKPYAKLRETVESGVAARKAMRNLLSTIVDESDGYWIADGFHEAVEAAVKIVPPEFMTALECDHCGDVAHESITGMFGDGDGVACMSCGWPGNVSADEESVYWSMDDDGKCTRSDCDECAATGNETKEVES